MIYFDKLETKLQAILDKNLDEIVANKIDLPFMGKTYTRTNLQAWLQKRIDLLNSVKAGNYTDAQITKFINNVYKTLSASDKLIADKIIAGQPSWDSASNADSYEKLVLIKLYKFVTSSTWLL